MLVLRQFGIDLPKDCRTLLHAPRTVNYIEKSGGQYIYFGIKSCIETAFSDYNLDTDKISLLINIDGLPLFKSSSLDLWPILCKIINAGIYVACLFCGKKKPDPVDSYLDDFINEVKELQRTGFQYNNHLYEVHLSAFTCDAPARAYLKCIKGHNAYNSCERCIIKGTWEGTMTFNDDNLYEKRTDEAFQALLYDQHQKQATPLLRLNFPCVTGFVLDYMHLVCQGVVKRIIKYVKEGPYRPCRLSDTQLSLISDHLISLKDAIPSDFARKPRSLVEYGRWKATEFRQFHLYTGPIVLKKFLPANMYAHFLCWRLDVAILLSQSDIEKEGNIDYAERLLRYFNMLITIMDEHLKFTMSTTLYVLQMMSKITNVHWINCCVFRLRIFYNH